MENRQINLSVIVNFISTSSLVLLTAVDSSILRGHINDLEGAVCEQTQSLSSVSNLIEVDFPESDFFNSVRSIIVHPCGRLVEQSGFFTLEQGRVAFCPELENIVFPLRPDRETANHLK